MRVVTVRLDEDLVADLEAEADERGENRTEYIRRILRNRGRIRENTGAHAEENTREYERIREGGAENTGENTGEYEDLAERVADLEARVEALEAGGSVAIAPLDTGAAADADVEPGGEVREALEASGWSHGRNEEERRRDAAVAAWALEYLREAGEVLRKGDFPLDALDDERKVDTIWLQVIRPALLAVAAETDAVAVDDSEQRYEWVGE